MITRRTALALAAGLSLTLASPALAAEKFTGAAFEAAQKAGKPILIDVFAPWCPTCKAQAPIIDGLAKNEKFKEFVFLKIDFDKQKADLRKLNARSQSTLIVFKGETEVGRSVGDTKPQSVEAMLAKALTVAQPAAATAPDAAPTTAKFTGEAFEAAQKAGKPILIDVFASWCPTCKAQAPIIEGLTKNEKFKDFVFLKIDFDTQKDDLRKLNVRNQSTLIVFKGEKEVGRSIGDTKPESVEEMVAKAL